MKKFPLIVLLSIFIFFSCTDTKNEQPIATVLGKYFDGKIPLDSIRMADGLSVVSNQSKKKMRGYEIQSFELVYLPKGKDAAIIRNEGNLFNEHSRMRLDSLQADDKIVIRDVRVRKGAAQQHLNSISLVVK